MNIKIIHRSVAGFIFLVSFISYILTTYPSLSFWDCGEFIATTHSLSIPHAPGAPFFALYSKVIALIPFVQNYAQRINIVSCFASALTVMLVYLISVRLIKMIRGNKVESLTDITVTFGSSLIGALVLAWSDTFWFNAIEAEVYASSMFFISIVIWLALRWHEKADESHSERYILLIAYLLGLSIGVHQLSLLAYFGVALIIYFRRSRFTFKSFSIFGVIAVGLFLIIYPGIVLWLPNLLDGKIGDAASPSIVIQFIPLLIVIAAIYGIYYSHRTKHSFINLTLTSALLVLLGYSTYTFVLIRAKEHPAINEVNPDNLERLSQYLNREQYGDTPIIRGATFNNKVGRVEINEPDKKVWFPRRWSPEDSHTAYYKNYKGDGDYFLKYQFDQMFLRYFFWNFIGRAGDIQDAPAYISGKINSGPENGKWSVAQEAFPNAYYGIPFLLGLLGMIYHFRKDWKMALVFLSLFLVLGVALLIYFNMAQPQPRERDYFYVGAFLVFAIWISIGASAIGEYFKKRIPRAQVVAVLSIVILFFAAPLNMAKENWYDHDHSKNWIPWDLSYNTLQSCEKDAILFTNGDNDTFPLWYLQEVEGVRRDVRVICLSLLNTDWYCLQLKNEQPYSAKKVPMNFTDDQIIRLSKFDDAALMEIAWREEKKQLSVPVPASVFTKFKKENAESSRGLINLDSTAMKDGVMRWTSKARQAIRDMDNNVLYIRQWQDIMIEDIIKANKWQRHIYFAVTCVTEAFIGLNNFLRMDGLALQITPIEGQQNTYIHYPSMYEHLFNQPEKLATTPQRGFSFRYLNTAGVYFDDNVQRLMTNYRNAFIRLALYHLQTTKDKKAVVETLDKMFEVMPLSILPLDYKYQYDFATIYLEAGTVDKYHSLAFEIEKRCWSEIQKNPYDITSFSSPYRFLLEMYQQDKKYDKAIAVLDTLMKYNPNVKDVQGKKDELLALQRNQQ